MKKYLICLFAVLMVGLVVPESVFAACGAPPNSGEKMIECIKKTQGYNVTKNVCVSIPLADTGVDIEKIVSVDRNMGQALSIALKSTPSNGTVAGVGYRVQLSNDWIITVKAAGVVTAGYEVRCTPTMTPQQAQANAAQEKKESLACYDAVKIKQPKCAEIWALIDDGDKKGIPYPLTAGEKLQMKNVCEPEYQNCIGKGSAAFTNTGDAVDPTRSKPAGYDGVIPDCAFTYGGCRDINDLLLLGINAAQLLLSIIGTVAFLMFMYGGVVMITSFGNAEKFKQGQQILIAAVVGIIIALGAYLLVDTLLDALGVASDFRVIK
ncbi:pilin [Patescibacteria group bacterium]|nr:pilin [Patescibacteria group bacterium]MBU1721257.1 pilin [Patescibacteria group bacterium]MBU1901035.1 pilin [Patescibacteria group bacterium]